MPDGPTIILTLKILVSAVTVLFAGSLVALATGRTRLHGLINKIFFALTISTVFGFELLLRLGTDVAATFSDEAKAALRVHLCFAVPSASLLPVMLISGVKRRRTFHISVGVGFLALWTGTFVTGVFFLPLR
ncbi:MAG TPA: hypothetical protein VGJ05_13930 [Fimbriiglobus sp.]